MNMRNRLFVTLCCVFLWTEVRSENEYEVKKKGVFPFMAILYYPDEAVVDATGSRFLHAAVLFKPEWLLSASIDHGVLDNVPLGFPRKTLLARMGSLTFDTNFTLSEDDDEQEREVIQIVKPSNHNADTWWKTDITLLQTLLPFKLSTAIAPTTINPKRTYVDNNCVILFYAKRYGSVTEVKLLMQLGVELLPASSENCGAHFSPPTMTCASHDPADDMKSIYDLEFCPGNSGGPLLCEGEVMALQTYVENNCKPPHLYQLLAPWDTLINCAMEQKCNVDKHCNVCTSIHKDDLPTKISPNTTQLDTVKETKGEAFNSSYNMTPESSIIDNNTSSEIYLEHEPKETEKDVLLSSKPHVLMQNYSAISNETKSFESEEIKSPPSYENQTSEQNTSSTSEKSQSPMLPEIVTSKEIGAAELEKLEPPTIFQPMLLAPNTSVSTLSTPAWFVPPENARRMDLSNNNDFSVIPPQTTMQTTKITMQTTKIRNLPKVNPTKPKVPRKQPVKGKIVKLAKKNASTPPKKYVKQLPKKGAYLAGSKQFHHPRSRVSTVRYEKRKSLRSRQQYSVVEEREGHVEALRAQPRMPLTSDSSATNRKNMIPLILPLIILIPVI